MYLKLLLTTNRRKFYQKKSNEFILYFVSFSYPTNPSMPVPMIREPTTNPTKPRPRKRSPTKRTKKPDKTPSMRFNYFLRKLMMNQKINFR